MTADPPGSNLTKFDAAKYLETPSDMARYLEAAFEGAVDDNNPGLVVAALTDVARARAALDGGQPIEATTIAADDENPTVATLLDVIRSLGFRLNVTAVPTAKSG